MTKAELKTKIEGKKGFHSFISDELASDHVDADPIEKRYFYINHLNATGTMGKTFVFYLWNKANDEAWFYNVEEEHLDNQEPRTDQVKLNALTNYLKTTFDAYFVNREMIDFENNWAEATVYSKVASELKKETILVFKGTDGIEHLKVV